MDRAGRIEVNRRIDFVLALLFSGVSRRDIGAKFVNEFKTSRIGANRYIRHAHYEIERGTSGTRQQVISWHIAARLKLLEDSQDIEDKYSKLHTSLEILKDLGKIQGLYKDIIEVRTPEQETAETEEAKRLFMEQKNKEVQWENGKSTWGT